MLSVQYQKLVSAKVLISRYSGITVNTNAETGIGMISDTSIGKHTGVVISTIPVISILELALARYPFLVRGILPILLNNIGYLYQDW